MRAEIRVFRNFFAEFSGDDARLQRPQPDADLRHSLAQRRQKSRQPRLPRQVPAPGGDLDARNHDLPVAPVRQFPGLRHGHVQRCGPDRTTGVRDDAVGAEIRTAVLNLQHGTGPFLQPSGGQDLKLPAPQRSVHFFLLFPAIQGFQQHFHEFFPTGAAPQNVHAQGFQVLGGVLGIAPAHGQQGLWMLPAATAQHGPALFVGHGGNGAGVDHIGVAVPLESADLLTPLKQKALHSLGLILIHLAAQGVKSKFHSQIHQNFLLKTGTISGLPIENHEKCSYNMFRC